MKFIWDLIPSALKATISVCAFIFGLGWGSFMAIDTMTSGKVRASVDQLEVKFMQIRSIDKEHFDSRFDRLEELIKDKR